MGPIDKRAVNDTQSTQSNAAQNQTGSVCGFGNNVCFDSPAGECCSVFGFCGNGSDYCSPGRCMADWGYCYPNGHDDSSVDSEGDKDYDPLALEARDISSVAQVTTYVVTTLPTVSQATSKT